MCVALGHFILTCLCSIYLFLASVFLLRLAFKTVSRSGVQWSGGGVNPRGGWRRNREKWWCCYLRGNGEGKHMTRERVKLGNSGKEIGMEGT